MYRQPLGPHYRVLEGTVVLFTLILPVLLGVMALGADFSVIYFNWTMVQKAADAAALAGASQLTGQPGSASTVKPAVVNYVNGYACLNGISDPNNTFATICPSEATHPAGFADKSCSRMSPTPRFRWASNARFLIPSGR